MLYLALALSAVLVLAVNLAARVGYRTAFLVALLGIAFGIFAPLVVSNRLVPVAVLNAALLCLAPLVWRVTGQGRWRMLAYTLVATVAAYALLLPSRLERHAEYERIRTTYPLMSIEDRLPLAPSQESPAFESVVLSLWEKRIDKAQETYIQRDRTAGLKLIHDEAVGNFVDSWGFGFGRMPPTREWEFENIQKLEYAHVEPDEPYPQLMPPAYTERGDPLISVSYSLRSLHSKTALEFLRPFDFGYVRDRAHVAGFEAHGTDRNRSEYNQQMARPKATDYEKLELVSLLMHAEPRVYVADRLPAMDALDGVPTRRLDAFEVEGLKALRRGHDLIVDDRRMLGALRNAKQCIACHGGERGQLLGAFSYTLRPEATK